MGAERRRHRFHVSRPPPSCPARWIRYCHYKTESQVERPVKISETSGRVCQRDKFNPIFFFWNLEPWLSLLRKEKHKWCWVDSWNESRVHHLKGMRRQLSIFVIVSKIHHEIKGSKISQTGGGEVPTFEFGPKIYYLARSLLKTTCKWKKLDRDGGAHVPGTPQPPHQQMKSWHKTAK